MDIRIPSHYYYGSTKRYTYGWDSVNLELHDVDAMEVPWEDKIDKIFWRGATTGGGSHPPGFAAHYQRHRFLRMVSDKSNRTKVVTFADPPTSGANWVAAEVPVAMLNEEIMDAAFVKAISAENYPGGQVALEADHRFGDSVPLGRHWAYKYLIDLDGMSYSGRFMAFLASDSVPIKSTVYDEFYTDWIQPWQVSFFSHQLPLFLHMCHSGFILSRSRRLIGRYTIFMLISLAPLKGPFESPIQLQLNFRQHSEGQSKAINV